MRACVAIETITPRLQELIKKRLRVERAQQAIGWMADRGVLIRGFFMIGFPTETLEEIEATIDYAVRRAIWPRRTSSTSSRSRERRSTIWP